MYTKLVLIMESEQKTLPHLENIKVKSTTFPCNNIVNKLGQLLMGEPTITFTIF
jgi:hypothetical protein